MGCKPSEVRIYVPYTIRFNLFVALKSIQALDLSGSHIIELPSSIGNVVHLCYLDLSFTLIESLPESIDQLHQLQTLRLEGCTHLYNLPDGMKVLIGLRYLDFDVLGQLTCMPKGVGALTELCTLSAFIVESGEGCTIRELKYMNNLKGSFCISGLENVADHEAQTTTLSDKKYLTRLQLRWNDFKSYDDQKRSDIFWTTNYLEPNSCLEELQILYYPGLKLPPWIGSPLFKELVSITLLKCAIKELHTKLGKLPTLRYLNITFMYELTNIDYRVHRYYGEDPGSFPKLEALRIDGMPKLATWDGVCYGDFPLLTELVVRQCPKLSVLLFLPHLPSLRHLEISHCKVLKSLSHGPTLSTSLETLVIDACPLLKKRYMRGGEGWFEIEYIPDITIDLKDVRSTQEDGADDDTSSAGSNSDSYYSEGLDNDVHPYDSC
ncbi:putative disease resistance RPP13-like protein 1 [Chenopodium quinoa]|uniref:putative disease resistance RPP13-like protein 1 n=1 Tax=Chenopodium quinoa TaxID=63459 RepID=UPI000B79A31F|nr:putative disease resistance RPP13-like protein 1 [Chenopodium quinoa]